MKTQIALTYLTALFCSAANAATVCPEPPNGKSYGPIAHISSQASVNGRPFVKCNKNEDGNMKGRGYTYTKWECPTFTITHRGIGLASMFNQATYSLLNDARAKRYREKWSVTDKKGVEWDIYTEGFSPTLDLGEEPELKKMRTLTANGCQAVNTFLMNASGFEIILHDRWKKTMNSPAF